MIDYRAGEWGLHVAFGIKGSLAPRSLAVAIPCAVATWFVATYVITKDDEHVTDDSVVAAQGVISVGFGVMGFILYNRSRTSYNRWWEGGTLLQKARGEWFNAYSSIMAFTSTKPEHEDQVKAYGHFTARLFSLLMCCALQQVSPTRDRPFEILDLDGIEAASMEFLNHAPDKVEIILQWIQRAMVLHMQTGVLPVAPPILSRAFQEVSRGIVNLQNARKIADFPYPFPLAQVSMILQMMHYIVSPFAATIALPRDWAVLFVFVSIFCLWCIHFNALDLEFPFGTRVNDLPMNEFQQDWNKSLSSLLHKRATRPPSFMYNPAMHDSLEVAMSDASSLYTPMMSQKSNRSTVSRITVKVGEEKIVRSSCFSVRSNSGPVDPWTTTSCAPVLATHGLPEAKPSNVSKISHTENGQEELPCRATNSRRSSDGLSAYGSEKSSVNELECIREDGERQGVSSQIAREKSLHMGDSRVVASVSNASSGSELKREGPERKRSVDFNLDETETNDIPHRSQAANNMNGKPSSTGLLPPPKGLEPLVLEPSRKGSGLHISSI